MKQLAPFLIAAVALGALPVVAALGAAMGFICPHCSVFLASRLF